MNGKVPYFQLYDDDRSAPEPLVFRFQWSGEEFLAMEFYCVNTGCDCYNAELVFSNISGGMRDEAGSFFITVNVNTWTAADFGDYTGGLNLGLYVKEVMEQLPEIKERLADHVRRARWVRQAPLHPEDLISISEQAERLRLSQSRSSAQPNSQRLPVLSEPGPGINPQARLNSAQIVNFIRSGQTVGYYELFERQENEGFLFEFEDGCWYEVDDQYCVNPSCNCNEAVLHFISIDNANGSAGVDFAIRQKFNTRQFEIAMKNCEESRIGPVVQQFWSRCPGALKALKTRYQQMKDRGRSAMLESPASFSEANPDSSGNKGSLSKPAGPRIGRNDPCPCGSGKKYKRCCGASL